MDTLHFLLFAPPMHFLARPRLLSTGTLVSISDHPLLFCAPRGELGQFGESGELAESCVGGAVPPIIRIILVRDR
jgi:hypothetical protein